MVSPSTATTVAVVLGPLSAAAAGCFWWYATNSNSLTKSLRFWVPAAGAIACCYYVTTASSSSSSLSSTSSSSSGRPGSSSSSSLAFLGAHANPAWWINIGACVIALALGRRLRCAGLTGGIATGKSTVAKILTRKNLLQQHKQVTVLDLDVLAREVVEPGQEAYTKIVKHFGPSVLMTVPSAESSSGGAQQQQRPSPLLLPPLNRVALRERIAQHPQERVILNQITHPAIGKRLLRLVAWHRWILGERVVIDAPLLFEAGGIFKLLCCPIIVVSAAPPSLQFERLKARDTQMSADSAQKMIEAQWPLHKKVDLADIVIDNSKDVAYLEEQVQRLVLDRIY